MNNYVYYIKTVSDDVYLHGNRLQCTSMPII